MDYGNSESETDDVQSRKRRRRGVKGSSRAKRLRSVVESDNVVESETLHDATTQFEHAISQLFEFHDFSQLRLKSDHEARPLWVCEDGRIILEAFSPIAEQAQDFLTAISEPLTRPVHVHEYHLTEYSLYAAVSVGLETQNIIDVLDRLSKCPLPESVQDFIIQNTKSYGKVKLVLKQNRYWAESADEEILRELLNDEQMRECRVAMEEDEGGLYRLMTERAPDAQDLRIAGMRDNYNISESSTEKPGMPVTGKLANLGSGFFPEPQDGLSDADAETNQISADLLAGIDLFDLFTDDIDSTSDNETFSRNASSSSNAVNQEDNPSIKDIMSAQSLVSPRHDNMSAANFSTVITIDRTDEEPEQLVCSFEVRKEAVEIVRKRSSELSYPMLEEYDFRQDVVNPDLDIDLKPSTVLRPYQEKSLTKMFGNGRSRSGIIVLPCGAGKTLVGVTAACTIKKSCLVLCTSSVSVEQWAREFRSWSTVKEGQIAKFTSREKEKFVGDAGIMISTYTMVTFSGKRAYDVQQMMDFIKSREWGFLLLDEVHVVPADMFRKVLTIVAAHAKLGLTATLVREDDKIGNLNYLIGPKLFEANWMDLARKGHIANVQCAEVWCPMTTEFYREYLRQKSRKRQLLYAMNPRKVQACQYLIDFHENRGDKVIVFSDNVFALKHYATKLNRPYIYGGTSPAERLRVLQQFQHNPAINTVFLSKVGDTSIDLPEATCLIQISSHYGSRRQEAQRLGRILRAKRRVDDGFNAYFYSLVSRDTEEVYYSSKRQQFLIDQGYHFKIITELEGLDSNPELVYATRTEQLELLSTVLVSTEVDDYEEEISAMDDIAGVTRGSSSDGQMTVRRTGTLQSISGGDSMAYMEYSRTSTSGQERARRDFFSSRMRRLARNS